MIRNLQTKFIMISMLSIILVTGSIFGVIIVENYTRTNRQIDGMLNLISENDGRFPEYRPRNDELADIITQETQFSTRYFIIKMDQNGEIIETNMQHIASVNQDEALEMLYEVMEKRENIGYYENYKYEITQKDYGSLIVFLDCTLQLNNIRSIIEQSLLIIGIGLVIVFICVSILSRKALTPIIENIEKQKQFITNAGHELKTPVAVIMANADVMEMTSKENTEWIKSIKNQATRLDILIKSLLSLANIEEKGVRNIKAEIDYPLLKKTEQVILGKDDKETLKNIIQEIEEMNVKNEIPKKIESNICKKCAYYDLCYV